MTNLIYNIKQLGTFESKKTKIYIFGSNDSKGDNNKVFTFDNPKCIGLYKYVNINVSDYINMYI